MDLWQQRLADDGAPVGELEAVTSGLEIRRAAFSPSGDRLAYVKGAWVSNLWRVPVLPDRPATWSDAEQMTFDRNFIRNVAVARNDTRIAIAIVSNRGGVDNVWLVEPNGKLTPLTTDEVGARAVDWSPDGQRLVFALRSGERDIWISEASGGAPTRVTYHPEVDNTPAWSPDGREVAFVSYRKGKSEVWITSIDGGPPRPLTKTSYIIGWLDWSPDGSWISYMEYRYGSGPRLMKVAVPKGKPRQIGNVPIWKHVWASETEVYFISITKPEAGNVWALSVDAGETRPLTDLSGKQGTLGGEALDTDGKYVYFTWEEDLGDLWLMDVVR